MFVECAKQCDTAKRRGTSHVVSQHPLLLYVPCSITTTDGTCSIILIGTATDNAIATVAVLSLWLSVPKLVCEGVAVLAGRCGTFWRVT